MSIATIPILSPNKSALKYILKCTILIISPTTKRISNINNTNANISYLFSLFFFLEQVVPILIENYNYYLILNLKYLLILFAFFVEDPQ